MRLSFYQLRAESDFAESLGLCQDNTPEIAKKANRAQRELVYCGGETGWWGGWQKVVFTVSRCAPYITLPRPFARAINMDVCRFPIRIQNEFYEFLEAGIGKQGWHSCRDWCGAIEGYERGVWPTMVDLTSSNQYLQVYITDVRDVGKRICIGPALDQNGNAIYSQDGRNAVNGFFITFQQPFATTGFIVTSIGGVLKDQTFGDVLLYQVDATTGAQVLLSRYGPSEIAPAYRRYYIHQLPKSCGPVSTPNSTPGLVGVTAMVKLEPLPVKVDTDFFVIGHPDALTEQAQAIRYSKMDEGSGMALAGPHHIRAIKLLQDEMRHYLGELRPAVNYAPFGVATLERSKIGSLI